MALKVLVVPDKFKGTLTAHAAAAAMAAGWRRARPADRLELLPMSDGGDGFGEVLSEALEARVEVVATVDAAHRRCRAQWWWEARTGTAVIESAKVVGLAKMPAGKFHPFQLDTFGLGAVLRAAAAKGARRCLVGIGGSATNDGGFGVARALGWEFLDRAGRAISEWPRLEALEAIRAPKQQKMFAAMVVAVDVQNRLLGARGCTRIYGPQKGLQAEDFPEAERALRRLAVIAKRELGRDYANEPGAGAAGGLGFGLSAFLGARLESGFEMFAEYAGLERRLRGMDLTLTGEGAIDASTLMGKGVGRVAELCQKRGVACVGLAGMAAAGRAMGGFTAIHGLTSLATAEEAKARPAFWLRRLAEKVARDWKE